METSVEQRIVMNGIYKKLVYYWMRSRLLLDGKRPNPLMCIWKPTQNLKHKKLCFSFTSLTIANTFVVLNYNTIKGCVKEDQFIAAPNQIEMRRKIPFYCCCVRHSTWDQCLKTKLLLNYRKWLQTEFKFAANERSLASLNISRFNLLKPFIALV